MILIILQMLAGQLSYAPAVVGDILKDINGVAITVGSTVKFVGTVTAIYNDPHYGTIQVTGLHPNGEVVIFSPGQGIGRSYNYSIPNPQQGDNVKGFEPLALVVGS